MVVPVSARGCGNGSFPFQKREYIMPQFLCALWPDIGPRVVFSLIRTPVRR